MTHTADAMAGDSGGILDFALERYLDEEAASAIRICGGLLERLPEHAAAWFVVGLCLAALGQADGAAEAFHTSFHLARGGGQFVLAAAAAHELGAYGDDTLARLERLANYYLAGTGGPQLPPPLPLNHPVTPWATTMAASEVVHRLGVMAEQTLPEWGGSPERRSMPKAPWAGLDAKGLAALLLRFKVAFARAGTALIQEESAGSEVFVIASGSAVVHRSSAGGDEATMAVLGGGEIFGEMAALTRTVRTASVTTQRVSIVLVATAAALDEVVEHHPGIGAGLVKHCRQRMLQNLFAASSVLKVVEPSDRARLLACFETVAFEAGDVLMEPGRQPDGLHVIALGKLRVTEGGGGSPALTTVRDLGIGEVVGETAIVLRRPATALVTALVPTVTLRLPREQFLRVVENHPLVLRELYTMAIERAEGSAERSTCSARDIVIV